MKTANIECTARIRGIDEVFAAAEKLAETIQKAKTLADELTSLMDGLELEIEL